jgi:hydroxymethylbilane synthase
MIRIGTRSSKLALAQAHQVASLIEERTDFQTKIVPIDSKADIDQISQLTKFRGQGVFTSHLEEALYNNKVDVAVHSLKDLPTEENPNLPIIAFLKRDSPNDCLIIKQDKVISSNPLMLSTRVKIATGSTRRQAQIIAKFPDTVILDIRGNVQTRISKLELPFIDGLIMAGAVFDRIKLKLPNNVVIVDLDPNEFPPAPGQASIAVQTRKGEYKELEVLNDENTKLAVTMERKLLKKIGGGCDLSFGAFIRDLGDKWILNSTLAEENWVPGLKLELLRLEKVFNNYDDIFQKFSLNNFVNYENLQANKQSETISKNLLGKVIVITRSMHDSIDYQSLLEDHGAIVFSQPIFEFKNYNDQLKNNKLLTDWKTCEWVIISSQRAVPFLSSLYKSDPRSKRYAAVGEKTATELRKNGFPVHIVADSSMQSLQNYLKEVINAETNLLYLHGHEYTNLPTSNCAHYVVYQAEICDFELKIKPDYLIIYSKRAAESILEQYNTLINTTWIAIGENTFSAFPNNLKRLKTKSANPNGVLQTILEDLKK